MKPQITRFRCSKTIMTLVSRNFFWARRINKQCLFYVTTCINIYLYEREAPISKAHVNRRTNKQSLFYVTTYIYIYFLWARKPNKQGLCKHYFTKFMPEYGYSTSIRCIGFPYTSKEFYFSFNSVSISSLISYLPNITSEKCSLATPCNCFTTSEVIPPPCSSRMQVDTTAAFF